MSQKGIYGQQLADAFKVQSAPAFVSRKTMKGGEIGVTHLRCDTADNMMTSPCVEQGAFMMMLQMRDWPERNLWADDRPVKAAPLKAGAVSIFDLSRSWVGHRTCPIHQLNFYLPQTALDVLCDLEDAPRIHEFSNDPLLGEEDAVIHAIGKTLLRAFDAPDQVNRLFIEHVTSAAAIHAVRRYGVEASRHRHTATLTRTQLAGALEQIDAHLDGNVTTADMAARCGLPLSAFAAAFHHAMGQHPHQWLLERRVARAMGLIRAGWRDDERIAAACGFVGTDHLHRVFERSVGVPLRTWHAIMLH